MLGNSLGKVYEKSSPGSWLAAQASATVRCGDRDTAIYVADSSGSRASDWRL